MPAVITAIAWSVAAGTLAGTALVLPAMARIRRLLPDDGRGDRRGTEPGPATGPRAAARPTEATRPIRAAVVVAARNESDTIEPALRSLLRQADDRVLIVVVDDRSTDGTTEIVQRLAAEYPALLHERVDELPPGWLGKNHALQRGADAAGDVDYLLFTDADVVFAPGGVHAAVRHADQHGLDHLTGAPRVAARSFSLAGMIATFGVLFALFTRPWSVRNPRSSAAIGIGALNLVRRTAYEAAGGHGPIRMRIDDDLRLARLIKAHGGRSEFLFATEVACVEWYPTLGALVRGLHKNAFAGIDFRVSVAVAATVALVLVFLSPFVVPFLTGLPVAARAAAAVAATLHVLGASHAASRVGLPRRAGLFFPLGIVVFLFILWRSMLGALVTRQVVWRGTAYPLRELLEARAGSPPVDRPRPRRRTN